VSGSGAHAHSRKQDKHARQTSLLNTLLNGRLREERRVRRGVSDCDGSILDLSTTEYTYTPNGNIASVKYPSGRTVAYLYGSLETNLPSAVRVNFRTESGVRAPADVVTDVKWRADRRLDGYTFNGVSLVGVEANSAVVSYSTRVTFEYAGADAAQRPTECGIERGDGSDLSGRLRRIQVRAISEGKPTTVLYERWLTWAADQIVGVDVCYEGQLIPAPEFDARVTGPAGFAFDRHRRLRLSQADDATLQDGDPNAGRVRLTKPWPLI